MQKKRGQRILNKHAYVLKQCQVLKMQLHISFFLKVTQNVLQPLLGGFGKRQHLSSVQGATKGDTICPGENFPKLTRRAGWNTTQFSQKVIGRLLCLSR